jgi:chromosome segregation ATPase
MAITQHDVFAAADRIVADGGNPTLAAVRKALGGGSFTTISEWMTDWKTLRQAPIVREPAPTLIAEQSAAFAAELWHKAQELANARMSSERDALEATRIEMQNVSQQAVELADQLSEELETAQATITHLNDSLLKLTDDLLASQSECTTLEEQLTSQTSATHTALAALHEAHARVEQLTNLLEQERTDRRQAEAASFEAQQRAAVLEERLDGLSKKPVKAH